MPSNVFQNMQHCLVVKHDQRYTVDEALRDPFFRDSRQCREDLADLETKLRTTWITPLLNLLPQESFDEAPEDTNNNNNNFNR